MKNEENFIILVFLLYYIIIVIIKNFDILFEIFRIQSHHKGIKIKLKS